MQSLTSLTNHLHRWEEGAKSALTSTKKSLDNSELSLEDLRCLISTYADRSALLDSIKNVILEHEAILQAAQHQYDKRQRGRGMGSLPVEIIGRIFYSVGFERNPSGAFEYCRPQSLVSVARVSHLWREIALETPHLWTYFRVTRRSSPELLSFLLQRSKACSLTLDIDMGSAPTSTNFGHLPPSLFNNDLQTFPTALIDLCRTAASRCQILAIAFSSREACDSLLTQLVKPSLEELYMYPNPEPVPGQHHVLPVVDAPNLRIISSSNFVLPSSALVSNLTHINTRCDLPSVLHIVAICPRLVKAVFLLHVTGAIPALSEEQEMLVCQELRHLEIEIRPSVHPWTVLSYLFTALSLPVLDTLGLTLPIHFGTLAIQRDNEPASPSRAFETVSKLIVDFWDDDNQYRGKYQGFENIFTLCPNVQHLEWRCFVPRRLRKALELESGAAAKAMPRVKVLALNPRVEPGFKPHDKRLPVIVDDVVAIVDCWRPGRGDGDLRTVLIDGELAQAADTIGEQLKGAVVNADNLRPAIIRLV